MDETMSLEKTNAGSLAAQGGALAVRDLERALLEELPAADACDWDRTGMLVGNPADPVRGVTIALDPTIPAVDQTADLGANVLVTHHPVFIDAPESFVPAAWQGHTPGAVIRRAIERGVSIISFHTALDVSKAGLDALPSLLRLRPAGVLEPLAHDASKGFGRICAPEEGEALSLRHLSARCVSVFGSMPRVWGDASREVRRVVTCGGSAGSLLGACLEGGVDCLVCGEVKYHDALDASLSGLAIVELGHDVSEFPLCALLAAHVAAAGVDETCITMIDQNGKWYTPESSRR